MSTITLATAPLRDFLRRAAFINTNTLLPILSNLKLEHVGDRWQLVKNNLEAICTGPVQAEGEPGNVLLDERIFTHLVTNTKSEQITVTIGEQLVINDGSQDTTLPVEDPANFPLNPEVPEGETIFQFTAAHLRAIGIARHFTSDGETSGNFQFVHLHPIHGIFAVHNNYLYVNTAFEGLPELSLRKDECDVICSTEGVGMLNQPNHHVFFSGGYTYIFTKSEAKVLNLTGVVDKMKLPGRECTVNRDALTEFCNSANIVSESPLADCTMVAAPGAMLYLELVDKNYNRRVNRFVQCQGEPDAYNFNSRLLAPVLKQVPNELLEGKTLQNNLIVSGRGGAGNGLGSEANEWFCFMGLQKQVTG